MFRTLAITIGSIIVLAGTIRAGLDPSYSPHAVIDTVPFYEGAEYDPSIPVPNDYLKYSQGQWPLRYHELVKYLEILDTSSDRVKVEVHGSSYEDRPLYNVFISSEENIRNLEENRRKTDRLADPLAVSDSQELEQLVQGLPATAWMGYSIHGDEISGTDAAMQLIYHLTAATDKATLNILDNVVIIVDPSQNPDGRERYVSMLQTYKSKVPNYNRFSQQHGGVWPWGRTNHYLFDMNRDWALVRLQETKSRIATIVKWHPQLSVDGHEMGSNATFLFSPPTDPINYNTPRHYFDWSPRFAADQAAAFDQRGWPYYTGEWHEQWYPGYGSAWPTYSGSIGILYEMAGVDGRFVKQRDDYLLTYHEAINKQFTSSIANLTTLADNRVEILRDYHNARKLISNDGKRSKLAFLFKPDRDEVKMKRFIESLILQGIEVKRTSA
ncbi:MAG: peptidase, partial [Candidatus Zixiibacteriota bacterium]